MADLSRCEERVAYASNGWRQRRRRRLLEFLHNPSWREKGFVVRLISKSPLSVTRTTTNLNLAQVDTGYRAFPAQNTNCIDASFSKDEFPRQRFDDAKILNILTRKLWRTLAHLFNTFVLKLHFFLNFRTPRSLWSFDQTKILKLVRYLVLPYIDLWTP